MAYETRDLTQSGRFNYVRWRRQPGRYWNNDLKHGLAQKDRIFTQTLYLRFGRQIRPPPIHITNLPKPLSRFPIQLVAQQSVHAHLCFRRPLLRHSHRHIEHFVWLCYEVYDSIFQGFGAGPAVRLQKHFARDLGLKFEAEERADAGEVQAEVYGGHA